MFKPGDKVICIDIGNHIITNIVIGEIYTVSGYNSVAEYVTFKETEEIYDGNCFILLKEQRKQKLENLKKLEKI